METLIEKLKTVDKKVWIGVGIGAAVVIILIVALVIGLGNNKPTGGNQGGSQHGSQADSQYGTETEGGVTEMFGTEDVTEEIGTEIATETEITETESQEQDKPPVISEGGDVGGVEQLPVVLDPDGVEINGKGTVDMPYIRTPNLDTMSVTTIVVPAGQTLYYDIYRVGGMYLTIEDPNAYVIEADGTRHDAVNGKVGFTVENAMSNETVSFQIGNKGGSSKSFVVKFVNLEGSQANPKTISGNGPHTKHLNAGDEVGYYFKYNAAQGGTLRIYMSATAETEMNVQNNSGAGTVAASFSGAAQTDEQGREYIEIPVSAGDEVRIHVQAVKQGRNTIPATDITFEFAYQ